MTSPPGSAIGSGRRPSRGREGPPRMDLYEHMGKDLFRAHGIADASGHRRVQSRGRRVGDARAGRALGREDPGPGRRPRQGRRRRALRDARGRRRGRRPHARHRLQGLPRDARPRRGAAADRARVLHLAPAGPLAWGLPGDDDRRGRRGDRGARPDAAGGAPEDPHRPAARPPRVSRARAGRDAPGGGVGGRRRRDPEDVRAARGARRDAGRDQPARPPGGRPRRGARRQGDDRRQRPVASPGHRGAGEPSSRSTTWRLARRRRACST